MDSIIKAEHITKAFTNHTALDDVSLEVRAEKSTDCLALTAPARQL